MANSKEARDEYNNLPKDYEIRAKYRSSWLKGKYEDFLASKSYEEEQTQVTKHKGQLLALQRIAHKEGGGMAGLRAAANNAIKCIALGPEWYEYDEFTKRVKFMYFIKGQTDTFKQAWKKKKEWSAGKALSGEAVREPAGQPAYEGLARSARADVSANTAVKGKAVRPSL